MYDPRRTDKSRRNLTALAVTVVVHAAVAGVLMCLFLRYNADAPRPDWPPADSSELLFGGDIVKLGDFGTSPLEPAAGEQAQSAEPSPAVAASAPADAAPEPAPASTQPSPAKAVKTDARAEALAAEQERQRREQAAAEAKVKDKVASRMSFGSGTEAAAGQPDGTSATGAVSGVSASGFGNRRALAMPAPPRGPMGKVVVKVSVDRQGRVTAASIHSGSGAAGASAASRDNCLKAARASRFSASSTAPEAQTGYLTYNFL